MVSEAGRGGSREPGGDTAAGGYSAAAAPVFAFAAELGQLRRAEASELLRQGATLLDRFTAALARGGERPQAVRPARLALAFLLDQSARSNRRIDPAAWNAAARLSLFDGQDMSLSRLRDFVARAESAGPDYAAVAAFLADCLARSEGSRVRHRSRGDGWAGITLVLILGFAGLVAAWTAQVEWRFHRDLSRVFAAEALEIGLDRSGDIPDLAARLDRLDAARLRVARAAERAPLRLFAGPLGFDAVARAEATYAEALDRHLPELLARAIDTALATEGDGLAAYDTLRTWDILSGQSAWNPAWLAGWAGDRSGGAVLPALAPHIARMPMPRAGLPIPDGELMDQARGFVAETPEADRAWLELERSAAAAALPDWHPEAAVPGLGEILQRRSGRSLDEGIRGLFTAVGWVLARDSGAGLSVQAARAETSRILGRDLPRQNDAPDRVMARLQAETLSAWKAFLTDLRVRPFTERDSALLVSGRLSARTSPLEALLRTVWAEAGGSDRLRPHPLQLRIATEFGPAIQYLDQGRMAEITSLFAALNVALAESASADGEVDRLMSVTDRAQSIAALGQAPAIVVQIVEDVLAQTAVAGAGALSNPVTRRWQSDVLPLCSEVAQGRFPFAEGPDADLAGFVKLFGPSGALSRFYQTAAAPYIDTSTAPWRWKPEARFAGLSQESAAMLQRGLAIGEAFATVGLTDTPVSLAALAERGRAFVSLGGSGAPVEAAGEPARLSWPGAAPEAGVEASFTTPEGQQARLAEPGVWGLLRLLDRLRVRSRDDGRRFLVDLRIEGARLFMEMTFDSVANPVAGRALLKGFSCPTAL